MTQHTELGGGKRPLHLLLVGLCFVLFTASAVTDLALPGPQYDEASHACLTIDMLNPKNPFSPSYTLTFFGRPFPFGTDPHTGASKAYLFLPFFRLFGPDVETQRAVTLLMGTLAILFSTLFMRKALGFWPAFWSCLLLSTDTALIFYAKLDAGPIVEKLMWMMICLFGFLSWAKSRRRRYFFLGLLGAVVGIYSHIAFIWFVLASSLSLFLLYRKETLALLGRREWRWVGMGAAAMAMFFFYWLFGARDLLLLPILGVMETLLVLKRLATQGGIVPDVLGDFFTPLVHTRPFSDFFFLASIVYLVFYFRGRKTAFFLTLMFFLFIQISFTPGAILPHRLMMLHVFFPMSAGIAVAKALRSLSGRERGGVFKRLFSGGIVMLAFVSLIGQIALTQEVIRTLRKTGGTEAWSDAIYELAEDLRREKWEKVVCVDWGFRKNLFLITKGEVLLEEPFWEWKDEEQMEAALVRISRAGGRILFLLHPIPYWSGGFPTLSRFKAIVRSAGKKPHLYKTYYERSGKPVYLTYVVQDPT